MRAWRLPAPLFFIVLYVNNMTSSVPDSFNMDELSAMLENAPQEDDIHAENCSCCNGDG